MKSEAIDEEGAGSSTRFWGHFLILLLNRFGFATRGVFTPGLLRVSTSARAVASALVLGFSLGACGLKTQESVDADPPLTLSGPSENCFSPALVTFEKYFGGGTSSSEIDEAFSCVSGALEMFATYGRGTTEKDSFSAFELRAFLQKYFLGTVKMNDSLLAELMRVKSSLLGGDSQRLTKAELIRLTQVLEILRVEVQRLRPSIDIISQRDLKSGRPMESQAFETAVSDFNVTMSALGSLLGQSEASYKLESLKTLLLEVQALYAGRSPWRGPDWFIQQLPLVAAAKAVLLKPDGTSIAPDEWKLLFSNVGRLYGLYLRFTYNIKNRDVYYGDGLSQVKLGVDLVVEIMEDAIEAKGTGRIDYQLLKDFFAAMETSEAIELPVRPATLSKLMEPLFDRMLNPIILDQVRGQKLDPKDPATAKGFRQRQDGITPVNLKMLKEAILGWIEMQQLWERLEKDAVAKDASMAGRPLPIKMVRELWSSYSPYHRETWSDLKSLFDRAQAPAIHPDGRMMFAPGPSVVFDRNSFSGLNWKQAVVRTIGTGYVSDPDGLRMKGILPAQLKEIFDDFFEFTKDLGFLDDTDGDIWKTGFTISNIFLFASNGDDRLGFHEAVDLFVLSFGSSIIAKDMIAVDVRAHCDPQEPDHMGVPRIKAECWRQRVREGYNQFFSTLPGWIRIAKKWNDGDWAWFFTNLEKSSRKEDNPRGPLMSGEMSRTVTIKHYIESLFTRWDTNRDGVLTMAESDKAFFLFKQVLRDASGFSKNEEVRALYFYLLTFGKPPESWSEKLYWLYWKKTPEEWEKQVSANRSRLTQILGNLASSL